jgi:hypothetical protein
MSAMDDTAVVAGRDPGRAAAGREVVWGSAAVVSMLAVLVEADLATAAPWGACGDGGRGPLDSPGLLVGQLIAVAAAQAVVWVLAYRLFTALIPHRLAAAVPIVVAGACLLLLVGWGLLAMLGLPVSYADHVGTYPHWWPGWLPPHARILPCRPPE